MITFNQYLESQEYSSTKKTLNSIVDRIIYSIKTIFDRSKKENIDLSKINSITFVNDLRLPLEQATPLNVQNIKVNLNIPREVQTPNMVRVELIVSDQLINSARHIDAEYGVDEDSKKDRLIVKMNIPRLRDLGFLSSLKTGLSGTLSHELKHFNQEISGDADEEGNIEYLSHSDEVEAFVNQFHYSSRTKKDRTLRQYILDFLKGASRQYNLSEEDRQKLVNLYLQQAQNMNYDLDKNPKITPSRMFKSKHDLKHIAGILMASKQDELKKELVRRLNDINYQDKDGNTLLHYITYSNSENKGTIADWLIKNYKLNKDLVNNKGQQAYNPDLRDLKKQNFLGRLVNRV